MTFSKPVISLSTSYLQERCKDDGYAILEMAAELGYEYVELGHSTTISTALGIEKALEEKIVKVSSLHNFCPIPPFANGACPNLFSPATRSKSESQQWCRHTETSLDFAQKCAAKALVCHAGKLSYFFKKPDSSFNKFFKDSDYSKSEELENEPKFRFERDSFLQKSKEKSQKQYDNIFENVKKVYAKMSAANVVMGIENRDNPAELPLDWNFEELISMFKGFPLVRAWHDIGHSKRKELMHLDTIESLLERTLPKLAGWHLHDCDEHGKDHLAVGKGCIDFKKISKYFDKTRHIFVVELNKSVRRKDAADSLKRIQDLI